MDQHVDIVYETNEDPLIYPFDQDYYEVSPYYVYYIGPVSVLKHIGPILNILLATRILHLLQDLTYPNVKLKILISALSCGIQLHYYMGLSYLNVLLISSLILKYLYSKSSSPRHIVGVLTTILLNETIILTCNEDHRNNSLKLRSILMILCMKVIYFGDSVNLTEKINYLLHPASFLFGPWHRHELTPYKDSTSHIEQLFKQLFTATKILIQAIAILLISTIISTLSESLLNLIPEDYSLLSTLLRVYFVALEFRLTHYFTCYLSCSFLSLWHDTDKQVQVCMISKIEWPRSLVEVVVYWNITMHSWLKDFIFKPTRHLGHNLLITVLYTYLISSLLHGFKFHIWAVLLSLGLFTYVEHSLRGKLARRLDACVMSRKCQHDDRGCTRKHSRTFKNSILVTVINATFRLWAIIQLAYLGCIFVGDTDTASYEDALSRWSELGYFGHHMAWVTFLISLTI